MIYCRLIYHPALVSRRHGHLPAEFDALSDTPLDDAEQNRVADWTRTVARAYDAGARFCVEARYEKENDWAGGWKWGHESTSPEPGDLTPLNTMDMDFTPSEVDALEAIPPPTPDLQTYDPDRPRKRHWLFWDPPEEEEGGGREASPALERQIHAPTEVSTARTYCGCPRTSYDGPMS